MTPAPRLSPVSFDTLLVSVGVNRLLAALEVNAPLPLWFEELEQIYNLVSTEDWLSLREQYNQLLARQEEARTLGDAKLQEQLDLEAVKAWLNLMCALSRLSSCPELADPSFLVQTSTRDGTLFFGDGGRRVLKGYRRTSTQVFTLPHYTHCSSHSPPRTLLSTEVSGRTVMPSFSS